MAARLRTQPVPAGAHARWRTAASPLLAGGLVAAFFLLLLAKDPTLCWKDDYAISIMPVFADVARAWRHGEWPLLSPFSWACGNLAGEYQYGTFSPVVNLAAVAVDYLPAALPAKAAALSLSHLVLLAMGAALLGQRRGGGMAGGVLVGVIAALNGWNVAWGATDWFGALAANAWLPWAWWAFEEALAEPALPPESAGRWWWRCLLVPGVCVYFLIAAGFPYTVGMLGVITVWLALRTWAGSKVGTRAERARALWPLAAGWLLGLGLAAPAWLSLLEYIPGSDRAHGLNVVPIAWCVPWTAWPALILPSWRSQWPDFAALPVARYGIELAGGLVPLALLGASAARLGWRGIARKVNWELGLTGVILLLCMLPSPGLFRWSFRWLPLFALALALTGVRAAEAEDAAGHSRRRWAGNPGVWATAAVAIVWLAIWWKSDVTGQAVYLGAETGLLVLGWAVGESLLHNAARRWLPAAVALCSLWLVYQTVPANKAGVNTPRPGQAPDASVPVYAIGQNILAAAPLSTDRLYLCLSLEPYLRYRDWQTPPNFGALVRPGSTSMFAGVHLVNGYSPIMSAAIGRRLEMETHGNIPARVGADLLAAGSDGDKLLKVIGVDGLIVSFDYPLRVPPPEEEWQLVHSSDEGKVYHRRGGLLPAVTSQAVDASRFGDAAITRIVERRQAVDADVNVPAGAKPALITFRRPFFPGYRATLDERAAAVSSYNGLMPMVELPPGSHGHLELRYRPWAIILGSIVAGLTGLTFAALAAIAWIAGRRNVP
jgi:hypothetical protein